MRKSYRSSYQHVLNEARYLYLVLGSRRVLAHAFVSAKFNEWSNRLILVTYITGWLYLQTSCLTRLMFLQFLLPCSNLKAFFKLKPHSQLVSSDLQECICQIGKYKAKYLNSVVLVSKVIYSLFVPNSIIFTKWQLIKDLSITSVPGPITVEHSWKNENYTMITRTCWVAVDTRKRKKVV